MESGLAERRLIYNAQNGCEKSYNLLIDKYKKSIDRTARRYFIKGADSDDVLQECYIGFCKAVRDYNLDLDLESNFYPFLNLCINRQVFSVIKDSYSNKNKMMNDVGGEDMVEGQLLYNHDLDPSRIFILKEKLLKISHILNYELTDIEKKSLSLLHRGYTYKDISALHGLEIKQVNNAIYRAKKKLNLSPVE